MEYCTLKGFVVIWLIKHCTSEDLSTSIQSTRVTHQDGQTLPQEPGLPPVDVSPIVSPPSLQEVQQAVQEASEQVEGRGAEEVLKELLERVVEAALGQAEGGNDANVEVVEEEDQTLGLEIKQNEADTEAVEDDETVGIQDENPGVGENQEIEEVDALEDVAEKGEGIVKGEHEAGVEVKKAEDMEVIDESLGAQFSQEVVEGATAALEETGGDSVVEEEEEEEDSEEEEAAAEKEEVETEKQVVEEEVVEVTAGGEAEQETGPSLADVEQTGKEDAPVEESPVEGMEDNPVVLPDIVNAQTVEPVEVQEKEEVNIVEPAIGVEIEAEQEQLVEGAEDVDADETAAGEETESVKNEESVVNEESVQETGAEEQGVLETEKEDQEELAIPGPQSEDSAEVSIEQSLENQVPTPNPSLTVAETGENNLGGDETSNHGNEIITPTDDLLPRDPDVVQPTQDHLVKDTLPEHPQAEGEEPGEVNELVEDTARTTETNELGLEAWKIGAISAAVFLVLETVVIIIYILKCRNKNSNLALQRACEEGCVEPEAATGGDCSDDTLPAGNGDTQQIAVPDPSDVASTMAKTKEQQVDEHVIPMSDLPPSSTEESANTGPEPDSTQDLRTSML